MGSWYSTEEPEKKTFDYECKTSSVNVQLLRATIRCLILTYQNKPNVNKEIDADDIKLMMEDANSSLSIFCELLPISSVGTVKTSSLTCFDYEPDLVPKQPFNNIDLFYRMPHGYTRVQPRNLKELVDVIQQAAIEKTSLKAVGACYSYSNIAFSKGYIVEMNKYLHKILPIDETLLKDPSKENLCQMEAGTLIDAILEYLWPSSQRDKTEGYRTMMNVTGYSGLSIAGTTGCAAHGSGVDKPPMCDCIESVHLITLDKNRKVVQHWIEPTNGITNADKFNAKHGSKIHLIQDDDYFNAVIVHVGSLGVIYSYIIKVQPAFYLEEHRTYQQWDVLKRDLPNLIQRNNKDPKDSDALHSFQILISPYPAFPGNFSGTVLSTYKFAQPPRRGTRPHPFFASSNENKLRRLLIVYLSQNIQQLVPLVMFLSLYATIETKPVTMPSTEALSFGTPNGIKMLTSENAIDAKDINKVIDAVDDTIQAYQNALEEDSRFFLTSPISLRFTASSKAFLAMQYNRPTCMIETPVLLGTFGQHTSLQRIRDLTQKKYKSRPHWGQINTMSAEKIKILYPDSYEKFLKVYKEFNVTRTFTSYFTEDLK